MLRVGNKTKFEVIMLSCDEGRSTAAVSSLPGARK